MADIDLSLDDIIRKRFNKPFGPPQRFNDNRRNALPIKRLADTVKPPFLKKQGVMDARLKLLRNKIRREEGDKTTPVADARFRLEAMRKRGARRGRPLSGNISASLGVLRRTVPAAVAMDIDAFDYDMPGSDRPLLRTVENDMPVYRKPYDWDRPVEDGDLDFERLKRSAAGFPPTGGFHPDDPSWRDIRISVKNSNSAGTVGILKRPDTVYPTRRLSPPRLMPGGSSRTLSERFHHDRNAEAALKVQALKAQLKAAQGEPVTKMEGYRIVVSNLVPSVTPEDVQELFADVGELLSSKVVRPGVAEVVYQHYEDAIKAVDVYHNRQLDGQPMKCLLVKNNQAIPKRAKTVELDPATLTNALHKKETLRRV